MEADIKNVSDQLYEVNHKIDTFNAISQRVTVLEERANDRTSRLHKLEENQAKIVWAIVMAVLSAILKFVVIDRAHR
nr:MAG TPA: Hemolysin [Caudoviricetes sp.]